MFCQYTHTSHTKRNTEMRSQYTLVSDSGDLEAGSGVSCNIYANLATSVGI